MNLHVNTELVRLAEAADAEGLADLLAAAPASWTREQPVVVERVGDAVVGLVPGVPATVLNRVVGLGTAAAATPEIVAAIDQTARAAGARSYTVQLVPAARPAELPLWLERRGLRPGRGWVKMVRDLSPPPAVPTELRIERIDVLHAASFARVACEAFAMPPLVEPLLSASVGRAGWSHYLAFDDELPVACAALFVHDGAGWLGIDATLASHRRRGAQGALQERRIRDAADQGCRLLTTETGEPLPGEQNPSLNNMRRLGFELAYVRTNYLR